MSSTFDLTIRGAAFNLSVIRFTLSKTILFQYNLIKSTMSKIGSFVKEARNLLKLRESVIFVLGNESCDLDSAVCAVGLAYFYMIATRMSDRLLIDGKRRFLPLMNIHRANLPLKTEVTYFMRTNGIDINDIVCW